MDRYVVIGNPVSHSLSPAIHALFARQEGERIAYEAMPVPVGEFATRAKAFFEGGGRGANVTLPFKLDAFELADRRSDRAVQAGAANFLVRRDDGTIAADNTDGAGLVADLTGNLGLEVASRRVLVLGAGGATRGVLGPLLALRPSAVVVANRTPSRAQELAARFGSVVQPAALDAVPPGPFDLVVNATSSGTRGESLAFPRQAFGPRTFAYDMAYGAGARAFVEAARAHGAQASDGLGMLVEQAAESYWLWRGRRPRTDAVLRELRARQA